MTAREIRSVPACTSEKVHLTVGSPQDPQKARGCYKAALVLSQKVSNLILSHTVGLGASVS